jgi:hypothetical protein
MLGRAMLRDDSDSLATGVQPFDSLRPSQSFAARRTSVSVSRCLAAHAPTPRALHQTYQIAIRLPRRGG